MRLRFEGITLIRFHIKASAVPSYGFLYRWKIVCSDPGQIFGAITFQVIITGDFSKDTKYILGIFVEIIKAKAIPVCLKTPYDGCDPKSQADYIHKRIKPVFPEISKNNGAVVPEHGIYLSSVNWKYARKDAKLVPKSKLDDFQ
jgi:hypothetical protein